MFHAVLAGVIEGAARAFVFDSDPHPVGGLSLRRPLGRPCHCLPGGGVAFATANDLEA
jgi:hypothetical protein